MRVRGRALVWQQAERASLADPVDEAEFILRRVYPEMPERWFADVLAKLRARHAAGEWHCFERPDRP